MKLLRDILKIKDKKRKIALDDKTIFFIFNKIIQAEFGNIGANKFSPDFFSRKTKTIFVKSESSTWSSELWLNKSKIVQKINQELGRNIIEDIKIKK